MLFFCGLTQCLIGCSEPGPTRFEVEADAARRITLWIASYAAQHDGQPPASWDELHAFISASTHPEAMEFLQKKPQQEEDYVFLRQPLRVPNPDDYGIAVGCEIIMIGSGPKAIGRSRSDQMYRSVVLIADDGLFFRVMLREREFQNLIADASNSTVTNIPSHSRD